MSLFTWKNLRIFRFVRYISFICYLFNSFNILSSIYIFVIFLQCFIILITCEFSHFNKCETFLDHTHRNVQYKTCSDYIEQCLQTIYITYNNYDVDHYCIFVLCEWFGIWNSWKMFCLLKLSSTIYFIVPSAFELKASAIEHTIIYEVLTYCIGSEHFLSAFIKSLRDLEMNTASRAV